MTSELRVDNLKGSTTGGSINVLGEGTSATTNLQQGLAKAFAGNVTDSAVATSSFNIATITDTGSGDNRLAFTNPMSASDYSVVSMVGPNSTTPRVISLNESVAASYRIFCTVPSSDGLSAAPSNSAVFGDLA